MRKSLLLAVGAAAAIGMTADALAQNVGAIGGGNPLGTGTQNTTTKSPGIAALGNPLSDSNKNIPGGDGVRPVIYQDQNRGFMLVAPPGSQIKQRPDVGQIMIQSRRGYGVNVQTGDASPKVETQDMFARLEAQYMGDGKPWTSKVEERFMRVAGLPGAIAKYEAGSTRTSVVIVRGDKTDFVFMFFAPIERFDKLSAEFDLILASFRPAADELSKKTETAAASNAKTEKDGAPPLRAEQQPDANPAGRKPQVLENQAPSGHVFSEAGYGYRVEYPMTWSLEKVSAFTNVISGPKGTAAYDAIIALQNVKPEAQAPATSAATSVFDDLKQRLSQQAVGIDFVGEKAVTYTKYGLVLEGRQFVANYSHNGRAFRKWALVLPRPNGEVAHVWSYTAPREFFDRYRPVAEQVLNSLQINGG